MKRLPEISSMEGNVPKETNTSQINPFVMLYRCDVAQYSTQCQGQSKGQGQGEPDGYITNQTKENHSPILCMNEEEISSGKKPDRQSVV